MKLKNLVIYDADIDEKDKILWAVSELNDVITDNYQMVMDKEIAIEFNIGSRLGEPREYLVVYSNPDYKHNPYVFIFKKDEQELCKETTLTSFADLADDDIRKEVHKVLYTGFKMLPKHAFLSINQIEKARELALEVDLEER